VIITKLLNILFLSFSQCEMFQSGNNVGNEERENPEDGGTSISPTTTPQIQERLALTFKYQLQ
jgi:hypothetical protein